MISRTILMMLVWRIGIGSPNNSLIDILLHSCHFYAWYFIDITRRNSLLVTHGGWKVNSDHASVQLSSAHQQGQLLFPFFLIHQGKCQDSEWNQSRAISICHENPCLSQLVRYDLWDWRVHQVQLSPWISSAASLSLHLNESRFQFSFNSKLTETFSYFFIDWAERYFLFILKGWHFHWSESFDLVIDRFCMQGQYMNHVKALLEFPFTDLLCVQILLLSSYSLNYHKYSNSSFKWF